MTREEALQAIKAKMDYYENDKRLRGALETLIPELYESEDERIRKEIIDFIQWAEERGMTRHDYHQAKRPSEWIAYLERQKERKPDSLIYDKDLDKAAREFYLSGGADSPIDSTGLVPIVRMAEFGATWMKERMEKEQKPSIFPPGFGEVHWKPISFGKGVQVEWDEPQAEWGEDKFPKDIEADAVQFCFDKGINITPHQAKQIAAHYLMVGHNEGYLEGRKNAHIPARELGLPSSWDFQQKWNKATINGEPIPTENQSVDIPLAEWSEEDEKLIEEVCRCLCEYAGYYKEKDMEAVNNHLFKLSQRLKDLRPQPKKELSIEKAIKWLDDTFYFLDNSSGRGRDCEITTHDFDSLEEMYDSFRKAVIVDSEPHWKPGEEVMKALKECCECKRCIKKLYEDLQKRYGTC